MFQLSVTYPGKAPVVYNKGVSAEFAAEVLVDGYFEDGAVAVQVQEVTA